jgi:uncharacterized membrane protein YkoI
MKTLLTSLLLLLLFSLNAELYADTASISKQQAVNIATEIYPGRVIAIKRKNQTYQIKTLSESGTLNVIHIDAQSGEIKSGKKSGK